MSHEIVKTIKIKDNKVFINCASNNLIPLFYSNEEYPYFTKILNEEGEEAVNIALLKNYEEGNLQGGTNKYTRALKVLKYLFKEEYKKFDWSNNWEESEKTRDSKEFKELLKKALNYKFPKNKFIITKNYDGEIVYGKVCSTCIKWSRYKEKATKFDFEEEAKDHIYQDYKDEWEVEGLK